MNTCDWNFREFFKYEGADPYVSLVDVIAGIETNAIWQMILSVTIPFIVSAFVYYITFFRQVKKANSIIAELVSNK